MGFRYRIAPTGLGNVVGYLGNVARALAMYRTYPESSLALRVLGRLSNPVGAKAKTPPSARGLRCSRWSNRDKTTGRDTLRPIRHQVKTCDEVIPPCGLVQRGGPRVIWPIVTGPAWPLRVTGLICKGIPVITVCNPALWEYSGDNLGV
jgi:hypothetical protein